MDQDSQLKILLTPNVAKFPILKHQKAFSPRDLPQAPHRPVAEVVDDVGMCFEQTYRVSHLFGDCKQLCGGRHIGGQTEVRLLNGNEVEEVGRERGRAGQRSSVLVGRAPCGMRHSRRLFRWKATSFWRSLCSVRLSGCCRALLSQLALLIAKT
jgi:hypothetical protein